jgi:glycerophosphoryl diester phosphodiesterase
MPKWLRIVLGILAVLILAYAIGALIARPAPDHPWFAGIERPLVIAHQGGDGLWPSSTMYAYEHAAALHTDIVLEGDVHITSDGVLVLMHDETVDRTTDGTGEIEDMTLAEIKELDAGYDWSPEEVETFPYRGQGLQVATLEEVFVAFPERLYVLEIKLTRTSITEPLCSLIREHGLEEQVMVGSFHDDRLAEFRRVCPKSRRRLPAMRRRYTS